MTKEERRELKARTERCRRVARKHGLTVRKSRMDGQQWFTLHDSETFLRRGPASMNLPRLEEVLGVNDPVANVEANLLLMEDRP